MKRYCLVNVIKPEMMDKYIYDHKNPWNELLTCLKDAGTHEELIYIYDNLAIVFLECEDIEMYMDKFAGSEIGKKWLTRMVPYLAETEFTDASGERSSVLPKGLHKIFDLNQMLGGQFEQY
jgi:L-rhamnose mutarotase